MNDKYGIGLDIGSATTKIVIVDSAGDIVFDKIEPSNPRIEDQVEEFLADVKDEGYSYESIPLVATGYGRNLVHKATKKVTEITCHGKGVFRELKHGGTLVDIGGQDSKVITISSEGKVIDFVMNDKCAAGTGRFLENTAHRLGVPIQEIGHDALSVNNEVPISSTCTIFAESEIISLIAHGEKVPVILKGLHRSLIKRIMSMVRSIQYNPPLILSGGVVQNPAIQSMLEEEIGEKIILPKHPQLMGAYGAALIALEQ